MTVSLSRRLVIDAPAASPQAEQRKGAELAVAMSLSASRVDELQGPHLQWEAQLVAAAERFCEPLGEMFEAHARLGRQQAQHAELVRVGAAALEQEEAIQARRNAALLNLANLEEPLVRARQTSAASQRELHDALERCSVWHQQHVRAVEMLQTAWLSQLAGEISALSAGLPATGTPPMASRLQQAAEGRSAQSPDLPRNCLTLLPEQREAELTLLRDERSQVCLPHCQDDSLLSIHTFAHETLYSVLAPALPCPSHQLPTHCVQRASAA